MIAELMDGLNQTLSGSGGMAALLAAGVWGILSILLSPCHLAGIPLIVAYVNDGKRVSHRYALALASAFAVGILITLALIGALTVALGRMAGDLGSAPYYIVAVIFLLVGLNLLGVLPLPLNNITPPALRKKGILPAFLLGLIFGIALGPCSFAYMAPVLGMVFQNASTSPWLALGLLLAFGIGHCGVIALAGAAGGWVQRYLNWNEEHPMMLRFRQGCGVLLILGGLWTLYVAP
jgi:cytochrome c-type biogenesis protein